MTKPTMTYAIIRRLLIVLIAAVAAGCSKETPVAYNNPNDPTSASYIPRGPLSLTATAETDTGVALAWTDMSHAEEGFYVEKKDERGYFSTVASLPPNTTAWFDRFEVRQGITYRYRVVPFTAEGRGTYSDEAAVSFTLPSPEAITLQSSLSNLSFKLSWYYTYEAHTEFIIERSVEGAPFSLLARPDKNARSYIDSGIVTTKKYSYRIKVISAVNQSEYSPVMTAVFTMFYLKKLYTVDLGMTVHSLAFSDDGTKFAAAGRGYALRVWNASDGTLLRDFNTVGSTASLSWPFQVAFSHDGTMVASNGAGTNGSRVQIWNVTTGAFAMRLHDVSGSDERSMCFSRDDKRLIAGDSYGKITVWDVTQDAPVRQWTASANEPMNFVYETRDGSRLIVGGPYQGLQWWSTADWMKLGENKAAKWMSYSISPDEQYYSTGGVVRKVSTGEVAAGFPSFSDGPACFTGENSMLIGKMASGKLCVGLIKDPSQVVTATVPESNGWNCVAASPVSDIFITNGAAVGSVEAWKIMRSWLIR